METLFTYRDFIDHVGKAFRVVGARQTLTLAQIGRPAAGDPQNPAGPDRPFTLIFSGSPHPVVPEGIHTLAVENRPTFALYLIPIQTPNRNRQDYQAVFD